MRYDIIHSEKIYSEKINTGKQNGIVLLSFEVSIYQQVGQVLNNSTLRFIYFQLKGRFYRERRHGRERETEGELFHLLLHPPLPLNDHNRSNVIAY